MRTRFFLLLKRFGNKADEAEEGMQERAETPAQAYTFFS